MADKAGRPHEQQKAQKLIERIKKTGAKKPRERMGQPDARIVPDAFTPNYESRNLPSLFDDLPSGFAPIGPWGG